MNAIFVEAKSLKKLTDTFDAIEKDAKTKSVLFFMASTHSFTSDELSPLLKKCSKPITGGIFPALVYHGKQENEGVLFLLLAEETKSVLFDLSAEAGTRYEAMKSAFEDVNKIKGTVFMALDGFGTAPSNFVASVYDFFGTDVHYFGGGAGSPDFNSSSNIITNTGIHKNAGVIMLLPTQKQMGSVHGLTAISEPLKITESKNNKVVSINWKPAFVVYKEIVERFSGQEFTKKKYFELVNAYPLGVLKLDAEPVIRDVIKLDGTNLLTQNHVPEGEHVVVIDASTDHHYLASNQARKMAFPWAANTNKDAFCVVSYSRNTHLDTASEKELVTLQETGVMHGIFALGEVINGGDTYLEIANKSVGVVKW